MSLRLTITNPPRVPPGFDQSVTLQGGSVRIGRAPDNDLVLADPGRTLSKYHCTVTAAGGGYTLTDTSSNGVFVNGSAQRTPRDQPVPVSPGDVLQLGDYELRLDPVGPQAAAAPPFAAQPRAAAPIPADDDADDPFLPPLPDEPDTRKEVEFDLGFALGDDDADDGLGVSGANPFADAARLLRETQVGRRRAFDTLGDALDAPGGGESLLPHGPEGTLYAKPSPGRVSLNPFAADDHGDDWDAPPVPDDVPAPSAGFAPPRVAPAPPPPPPRAPQPAAPAAGGANLIPDDWDDEGDDFAPAPDDTQAGSPFFAAPPPAAPAPASPPPSVDPFRAAAPVAPPPPPAPAMAGEGAADALRAFLQGAGMGSLRVSEAETAAMLYEAGRVFRAMVAGLQEALATRAEIKEELDVSRTMIGATSNNPLKLGLSLEEGIVALLRRPGGGFLAPQDAVELGFRDVQAHQVATMAAMHLALRRLLAKFDPQALSRRLEETSVLNSLLPGARKSKYWEVYCDFYASIAGDAESEFHEFFTKEFSQAYEEQSRKLK
ncbi:MAG: type VI secretion system-associated FHA domain protein TagH [Alphaproteobacteria bacterium]